MSTIIPSLSGYICIRNNFSLGYCAVEGVESLLKVCSQVVVADAESTDGTFEHFQRMSEREPRIKLVSFPWTNPKGVGCEYWVEWLNFARQHLTTRHQITLDGDEYLDDSPECHQAIREACESNSPARRFRRLNYWKDPFHLIPEGHCCSPSVARMGLTEMRMPTDQPTAPGEFPINDAATKDARLVIHHLGFLRKPKYFYAKSKAVQSIWINGYDNRLTQVEKQGKPQWEIEDCEWTKSLTPYNGYIPDAVQRWMSSQGHHTPDYLAQIEAPTDPVIHITETALSSNEPLNVLHCGDMGDIIHGLSVLKACQRPIRLYFGDRNAICKRIVERLPVIEPLLRSQDWIIEAKVHEGEEIHWNAGDFRFHHSLTTSLAEAHYRHYLGQKHLPRVLVDLTKPWLGNITPDPRSKGKILFARTNRYNNAYFKWKDLVQYYGPENSLFLGLPSEHTRFCEAFGNVPYLPTRNLLEVAQLITGSDFLVANQSSVLAIAEAMKHPRLIEVCSQQPDVLTAITPEVISTVTGSAQIPAVAGKPPLTLPSGLGCINYLVQTNTIPRDGWRMGNLTGNYYEDLEARVMQERGVTKKEAKRLILDDLYNRQPAYFGPIRSLGITEKYEQAVMNAQRR
jgi:hypothetical protein